ncbi:MAG: hypothetical protein IJN32_02840, partial [Thermoguttaceae bacterium]|nr:hypothetical protein [Thermoguttaceae bacterium]
MFDAFESAGDLLLFRVESGTNSSYFFRLDDFRRIIDIITSYFQRKTKSKIYFLQHTDTYTHSAESDFTGHSLYIQAYHLYGCNACRFFIGIP